MGASHSQQASPPAWLVNAIEGPVPLTFASRPYPGIQQAVQSVQQIQQPHGQQALARAPSTYAALPQTVRSRSCGMAQPALRGLPVQRLTSEMLYPQLHESFDAVPLQPGFVKTLRPGLPGFSIAEAAANARHAKMLLEGLMASQSSQQSPTGVASYVDSPHTASAPASRSASPGPLLTPSPPCMVGIVHAS